MMRDEQIASEKLRSGDYIRVYVVDVHRSTRGPVIKLSRTHRNLLRRLMEQEIPEVDAWFGTMELPGLLAKLDANYQHELIGERLITTPPHYAYLKISEGCNNRCTFCIIPKLRGDLVSRPAAEVLREAEQLVAAGVKELLVVSQDTSAYGVDLKYAASPWKDREVRARFFDLARELGELGAWVRLQYVYPYPHVDEVIGLMTDGKVLPYLDIPFQHASPEVLKRMRRPAAQDRTLARIKTWRAQCPDLTLRSTFIVGFPGETESDFAYLLDWLDEAEIDRVGCFKYEPVAGATSNTLADPVPDEIKAERWNALMARQRKISARRLKRKVGTRQQVIIDPVGPTVAKGRSKADAPEIDGSVYVSSRRPLKVGEIVTARIERTDEYDLHGSVSGF